MDEEQDKTESKERKEIQRNLDKGRQNIEYK